MLLSLFLVSLRLQLINQQKHIVNNQKLLKATVGGGGGGDSLSSTTVHLLVSQWLTWKLVKSELLYLKPPHISTPFEATQIVNTWGVWRSGFKGSCNE